jgi:uncharacterized membrane protein YccF (DUF307 family)
VSSFVGNIVWFVFGGFWMAVVHLGAALILGGMERPAVAS